ncbi:D-alanyl-D-alanine carboxypeptidase [Clostridium cavendishii DSM 21758]|uniref:D-alanyl-D-alanine carboxypeptidase n=1 Tax=Clostridium cavendishii DSM 21758 TaxID=1121302 RepID=A0A1M6F8T4_9CLOT|nr:M15 family metallopeptidase [Clostridium cavendishii]SHI94090.1 D-alanyl-D-alanine carboxypeptidase [Clostridium cavendishii DSM 21758]
MKKVFKIILSLIIIFFGAIYILVNTVLKENYNISDIKNNLTKETINKKSQELLLVNDQNGLGKDYIPEGLTIPNIKFSSNSANEEKHVAGIMAKPLEKLVKAAKDEGVTLLGNSAYRSYKSQEKVYNNRVKSQGRKLADSYVAKPGFSEHQTGLCIDITNKDKYFVEGTKEADWLAKNCYKFGFIIRYPKGKKTSTGIDYEPWHIRYVGKEAAKYIYDNKITLEDYLNK